MAEEQSWYQKPLSQVAPDKLHLGASSPIQEWEKFCSTLGDAVVTSSTPNQARKNKMVENPPISSTVPCAAADDSTAKPDQTQAEISHLGVNYDPNYLDLKKQKRILSNRLSALKSRQKKAQYLADLEMQAKAYEVKIADLEPQLESYQNQKQLLLLEHQELDNQMVALEKVTLLKDAEIENNKTERDWLRELHMKQEGQMIANTFNCDAGLQPIVSVDQISNYYTNPVQELQVAQNGEDTPYMTVEIPPEQSQMPNVLDETLPMLPGMQTNLISKPAWNPNHIRHLPRKY